MHRLWNFAVVLCLFTGMAAAQQKPAASSTPAKSTPTKPAANLPSEEVVNAFLQQTFGYDTSLSWKIASIKPSIAEGLAEVNITVVGPQGPSSQKLYVTADGHHAVVGEILPFGAHPYEAARKQLEKGVTGPSRGPANAPVTLVEFSDLQCPHCKEAQPVLDKLMSENKNVRMVFQSFPLPGHDWAAKAAAYADCVSHASPEGFWKFVENVYSSQSDITAANADEKLTGIADGVGTKGSEIAVCASKPGTTSQVEKSVDLGKALEVNSTPTIFVNGRMLSAGGLPYEVLVKIVDFAAKEAK